MKNLIITISRQYGSGGRQIGQQLAKELNIPFMIKKSSIWPPKRAAWPPISSVVRSSS